MLNSGQNRRFVRCDLEIWWMTLKNNRAPLLCCFKLCASFHSNLWILTGVTVRKRPIWVKISNFFVRCDLEIWRITLKNNREPLLCCFKLCVSFHSHLWILPRVTVWTPQFGSKSMFFVTAVTLEFVRWSWQTIGHLFYTNSSFVHHFIAIGDFKLELQSGNAQFGSKWIIFFSRVSFNFDDRAPALSNIKLCASFCHHM